LKSLTSSFFLVSTNGPTRYGQTLLQSYKTADIGNFLAATCPNLFGNLKGADGTQAAAYVMKAKAAADRDMNAHA
jgi:hypothetical protein